MSITIQLLTVQLTTTVVMNSRSGLFLKDTLQAKFCIINFYFLKVCSLIYECTFSKKKNAVVTTVMI